LGSRNCQISDLKVGQSRYVLRKSGIDILKHFDYVTIEPMYIYTDLDDWSVEILKLALKGKCKEITFTRSQFYRNYLFELLILRNTGKTLVSIMPLM